MEVFFPPAVKYCNDDNNEGLTFLAGLTTSHISYHSWDQPDQDLLLYKDSTLIQADCYTCGPLGDEEIKTILSFITEYSPRRVDVVMYDRSCHDSFMKPHATITFDHSNGVSYEDFLANLIIRPL